MTRKEARDITERIFRFVEAEWGLSDDDERERDALLEFIGWEEDHADPTTRTLR